MDIGKLLEKIEELKRKYREIVDRFNKENSGKVDRINKVVSEYLEKRGQNK